MARRVHALLVVVTILLIASQTAGWPRNKNAAEDKEEGEPSEHEPAVPNVHFLVEMIGKQIYDYVNRPKYKFYIYMTVGKLPNEESTILFLSTICNVLYGCCIWLGFLFLPRDYMLLGTLLTHYVGPAMILILIGTLGLTLAAFAMYPVTSVFCMWLFYFLTSQMAQALGQYLGLDSDQDGDVDVLDVVHWVASTRVGKFLGVPALYNMLDRLSRRDPFQEIHRRLDLITERINQYPPAAGSTRSAQSSKGGDFADDEGPKLVSPDGKMNHPQKVLSSSSSSSFKRSDSAPSPSREVVGRRSNNGLKRSGSAAEI